MGNWAGDLGFGVSGWEVVEEGGGYGVGGWGMRGLMFYAWGG